MAFQRMEFRSFFELLRGVQEDQFGDREIAENFILEERLTEAREDSYMGYITSPHERSDWLSGHKKYLAARIKLGQHQGFPETFTDLNSPNLLPELDPDQFLVRLENLAELAKLAREDYSIDPLADSMTTFLRDSTDREAEAIVEAFLSDCNRARDLRPIFVGFLGEVEDLLDEDDDWANRLRDRLGLGRFDPMNGEPIPVLLLRYRVADVIAVRPRDANVAAIPTVLDSEMNPFFCPTPEDWTEGQTLDLTAGDDYAVNCEILHRYIEYRTSYVYRVGWITESPGRTCEETRRIHLSLLGDDFEHFPQLRSTQL